MNRAHVVGCPALRGGTPCTCQTSITVSSFGVTVYLPKLSDLDKLLPGAIVEFEDDTATVCMDRVLR